MLAWFRRRAPGLGAVVLLALGAMGASELSPHPFDCHVGCVAAFVEHDESAHRIGASQTSQHEHPLHCLACHWSRSFRPPVYVAAFSASALVLDVRLPLEVFAVVYATLAAQPPLRSPPSSPVLA
jgi:hypothetical protein